MCVTIAQTDTPHSTETAEDTIRIEREKVLQSTEVHAVKTTLERALWHGLDFGWPTNTVTTLNRTVYVRTRGTGIGVADAVNPSRISFSRNPRLTFD